MLSKFKPTSKPTHSKPSKGNATKGKSGIAARPKDNRRYGVEEDGDYLYALMQDAGIPDVKIDEFLQERKISLHSPTQKHKSAIRGFIRMQKREPRDAIQKCAPVELQVASASDISIMDEIKAIPISVLLCFIHINGITLAQLCGIQKLREFIRRWKTADEPTKATIIEYSMSFIHRNMKRATKCYITPKAKKCFCNGTGKVFGAWQVQCSCRTVVIRKP
jgi:hypothetical protein